MRIIVCAKHVVDSTEIRWDEERGEVTLRNLPTKISDYDRNALEAAVVLKESGEFVDLDVRHGRRRAGPEDAQRGGRDGRRQGLPGGGRLGRPLRPDAHGAGAGQGGRRARGARPHPLRPGLRGRLQRRHRAGPGRSSSTCPTWRRSSACRPATATWRRSSTWGSVLRTVKVPTPCVLGIDSSMNVPRLPTVLQVMKVKADRIGKLSLGRPRAVGRRRGAGARPPTLVASRSGRRRAQADRHRGPAGGERGPSSSSR